MKTVEVVRGWDGLPRIDDPHGPLWLNVPAVTRVLNRRRQNGDLISEADVARALAHATDLPGAKA